MRSTPASRLRAAVLGLAVSALPSHAASRLLLPYPHRFGVIPAATYDEAGRRVGTTTLEIARTPAGTVRLLVDAGVDGGAANRATAELAVVEPGRSLRLLRQESHPVDEDGRPLVVMRIDHEKGEATCTTPDEPGERVTRFALPAEDRVANVPLNLLFLPLATGERERIDFQVFLCRSGPRLVDFTATVAARVEPGLPHGVVEVRYRPDLGRVLSFLAAPVLPRFALWYDADDGQGTYLGHRMPLYTQGPEVVVIRDGVAPGPLIASR
jgi:hypothetical protein